MASGKKGKKTKGKTLALTDFLSETPGSVPSIPLRKSTLNWADEVDEYESYEARKVNIQLPTAPKSARDLDEVGENVPKEGPFVAYISNLPYEVDEEEIADFFCNLQIANMRFPKDDRPGGGKTKGFGYVEFEDRDSLIEALAIPDTTLKNRRIRIELASNHDDGRRRGRMDMGRDRERSEAPTGDWRSGPRATLPESDRDSRRGGGFDSDRRGFSRDEGRQDSDKTSGSWRDRNGSERPSFREENKGFSRGERDFERGGGGGGGRFGGDRDRDRERDGERRPFRRFEDRGDDRRRFEDRSDDRGSFTRNPPPARDEQDSRSSESRQRPKLMLAPRTKPIEAASGTQGASSSIFGNAKPVDTSDVERRIEERLAKDGMPATTELTREKGKESGAPPVTAVEPSPPPSEGPKSDDEDHKMNENDDDKTDENFSNRSPRNSVSEDKKEEKKINHENRDKIQNKKNETERRPPNPKNDINKSEKPPKRERHDKEMPRMKEPEPPNFAAENKFASLLEEDSD